MIPRLLRQMTLLMLSVMTSFLVGWLLRERLERQRQTRQTEPAVENPPVPVAPSVPVETVPAKPRRRRKDDLTLINGIGPAYERALNAIDIRTFAELAEQNAEELLGKLQIRVGLERVQSWIEQARQLSNQ